VESLAGAVPRVAEAQPVAGNRNSHAFPPPIYVLGNGEHREQRNARRRALRLAAETNITPKPAPNTKAGQAPTTGWKAFAGLAVGYWVKHPDIELGQRMNGPNTSFVLMIQVH
jgi:hypothetical protein